jgi:hypothetical protein
MNFAKVAAAAIGVVASSSFACHRATEHADDDGVSAAAPAPPPADSVPVDRLAPDELVEGTAKAFGLKLPREMIVKAAFADVVYAQGPLALRPVVHYFRARLRDGGLREGEAAATFEHVHVPGSPGLELNVHIERSPGGVQLVMRDTSPPSLPALPDDDSRRRSVGLTPEGRLLDPTHLE